MVENTETTHNVIVCTLCSCYPWPVFGLPPSWYKDPAYRARVVREPRTVLAEMGLELADDVRITVRDSSSEVRWLVLPRRPAGTERLSEHELIPLITRDAMIGWRRCGRHDRAAAGRRTRRATARQRRSLPLSPADARDEPPGPAHGLDPGP